MKVSPETVLKSENLIKYHLSAFSLSARLLGFLNSPGNDFDWFLVLFWLSLYVTGTTFAFIDIDYIFTRDFSIVKTIVETIQILCGLILMIVYYLNSFNSHRVINGIFVDLNEMDIQMSSLGFVPKYKLRIWTVVLQISFYSLAVMAIFFVHIFCRSEVNQITILYYCVRFFPIFCMGFLVFLFINIIVEVSLRLEGLNELVEKYLEDDLKHVPERQIYLFSVIYEFAFEICFKLNASSGVANLCLIGYCFISITSKIFIIFITLTHLENATIFDISEFIIIFLIMITKKFLNH